MDRVTGVINFVAENPLRPVNDQNVYYLSKWYYKVRFLPFPSAFFPICLLPHLPVSPSLFTRLPIHISPHSTPSNHSQSPTNHPCTPPQSSLVFVADNHLVWSPDRKKSKRFGALVRSPKVGLNDMLMLHQTQVMMWIGERVIRRRRRLREEEAGAATGMELEVGEL